MADPEHIADLIEKVFRELEGLRRDVSRLERAARRPERVVYRPVELAERLRLKSRTTVYTLWNDGRLAYYKDTKGRYSTEEQVQAYEMRYNLRRVS